MNSDKMSNCNRDERTRCTEYQQTQQINVVQTLKAFSMYTFGVNPRTLLSRVARAVLWT